MWYFTHYTGPRDTGVPSWYDDSIKRGALHWYLIFYKYYREDFRDTFERWRASLTDWKIPQSKVRKERVEKRFRELDDIIDKTIGLGYLIPSPSSPRELRDDIRLTCNYKGRDFLWPHYFIEACAREFGYTASILTSFIFGGGLTFLIVFLSGLIG